MNSRRQARRHMRTSISLAVALVTSGMAASILWDGYRARRAEPPQALLPAGSSYGDAANAMMEKSWASRDPALMQAARTMSWRELRAAPVNPLGWIRLAQIEFELGAGHEAAARQALANSFLVGPFSSRAFGARTVLAYQHWAELTPELRQQVLAHIDMAWQSGVQRAAIAAMPPRIGNSIGQQALSLKIASLKLPQIIIETPDVGVQP